MVSVITILFGGLVAASPDQIAFLAHQDDGGVALYSIDAGTGTVAVSLDVPGAQGPLRWSPNGQYLAFSVRGAMHIRDMTNGKTQTITHGDPTNTDPDWSPDGRRLAYTSGPFPEGHITVYELEANEETVWANGAAGFAQPNWFNESHVVAVHRVGEAGKTTLDLVRVFPDRISPIHESRASYAPHAEWRPLRHPTVDVIAFESNQGGDREVYVLAPGQGGMNATNHRSADINPVWHSTGEWLLFESFRGGRRGLYRVSPRHLIVAPIAASVDADYWAASPAPGGERVACLSNASGSAKLTIVNGEGGIVMIHDDLPGVHSAPAWRPEAGP